MAKTYEDVVTEARDLLQDADADRYSNTFLLRLFNRGLQMVARVRPDALYDLYADNDLNVPELSETPTGNQTDWTDPFALELQFYDPLVNIIVAIAEITDDEYSEDGRAAMMFQAFKTELMGL